MIKETEEKSSDDYNSPSSLESESISSGSSSFLQNKAKPFVSTKPALQMRMESQVKFQENMVCSAPK